MPAHDKQLVDTSPYNTHESFDDEFNFPAEVKLADTTLRDGEQMPGVIFSKSDKVSIAKRLDDVGVSRIEAGNLALSDTELESIRAVAAEGLDADVFTLSRALKKDIDTAVELGVDGVYIFPPTSGRSVDGEPDFDFSDSYEISSYAQEHGLHVSFFAFDNARVDMDVIRDEVRRMDEEDLVDSISVIDRSGSANPHAMRYMVEQVVEVVDMPVEAHCHNDFGQAAMNALFAASAGAEVIDVCVNGLGERTGNPDLAQVAAGLEHLYDQETAIDLDQMRALSKEVERRSNFDVGENTPLVGDNAFRFSAGYIINGIRQNLFTPVCLHPHAVGQEFEFLLDKNTTRTNLEIKLEDACLDPDVLTDEEYDDFVETVTERSESQQRVIEDHEFYEMVRDRRPDLDL
jgi:isopropylmalate/homocitrate/citramalate synthase